MYRSRRMDRRPPRRLAVRAYAVLMGALTLGSGSGCSFLFTDSPPARHTELPYFDCTSGRWAPNIDLTVAALYALVAVTTLSQPSERRESDVVGGSLLLTGAFGGSAVYGYQRTAACREAKAQLAERMARFQRDEYNRRLQTPDPWQAEGPPPAAGAPPPPAPGAPTDPVPGAPAPGTPASGGRP
jgi:hypothetical protein